MRYEVEPNQFIIRAYEEGEDYTYVASAIIRKYGDRGWMSSISSPKLFKLIIEHMDSVFDDCGVTTFEGYMNPAMARALRIGVKNKAKFSISHWGVCSGRKMPWVILSKLTESGGQEDHENQQIPQKQTEHKEPHR